MTYSSRSDQCLSKYILRVAPEICCSSCKLCSKCPKCRESFSLLAYELNDLFKAQVKAEMKVLCLFKLGEFSVVVCGNV